MNQMLISYKSKILNKLQFLFEGDKRTVIAKKNIIASFFVKGFGILLTFIQVPLLINYLDPIKYGVWLAISSIIQWFWFFDIGLVNGLRNKFAEAVAVGENEKARSLVSTTYAVLLIICCILILLLTPLIYLLNWNEILNVADITNKELKLIVFIVFVFFAFRLFLQPISSMLLGAQKTAINDLIHPASNLLLIVFLLVLGAIYKNSFFLASLILSISPIFIYLLFSVMFYRKDFSEYKPSLKFVNFDYTKSLFNLGILFFIVQLSGVVLYSTTNFLIIQLFSPKEVTEYNIAYKYFSSVLFFYSIIVNPFWSSFTEAYTKKDYDWIKRIVKKLKKISIGLIFILIIMALLSELFYKIWVGDKIKIDFILSASIAIFFGITIFNMSYCYFLNGIGRVKEQAIMSIISAIIHIPLSIFFVKYVGLKVEGIVISLMMISFPGLFIWPYLYKKEIISYR